MLTIEDVGDASCRRLLMSFGLRLATMIRGKGIPFSYWGEPEAGLAGDCVFVRGDTPIHSLLHETAHAICARAQGRSPPWGDAGSDDLEECAVCYLQVLLGDQLGLPVSRARLFQDMDAWGYSFRQGSSKRWFEGDGVDGLKWLHEHGVVDSAEVLVEVRAA